MQTVKPTTSQCKGEGGKKQPNQGAERTSRDAKRQLKRPSFDDEPWVCMVSPRQWGILGTRARRSLLLANIRNLDGQHLVTEFWFQDPLPGR